MITRGEASICSGSFIVILFKDPSIGLRVSLLRVEAELQIVRAYDRPEWQLDYTSSYIKLIEFLGFNGDHQLYINRRNATFEDIYRFASNFFMFILSKQP